MIEVYTDGASKGNPGVSGAGVYIKAQGDISEFSFPLGVLSNHEAEFMAVIKALEICKEYYPGEILSFRCDSKIVVDVVESDFTKNQTFIPYLEKIRTEISHFPHVFFKWIPEKKNPNADRLARKAIYMQ
ncbi:ribonuclease HI family protein [Salinibacillus xinjiangensis]|uniref:Reverse transcriptase-like protein n=1 Tax=Salinibacillus xinjiangensis TaxID=1229268 RepID=A0A6G1X266_9BACI|nr:ribonuclease HI family protein [Salinibacillus xinjiangensis]MRG84985.1 reverse transcriptase-like protein [Salinibacillus xinjiangensis]